MGITKRLKQAKDIIEFYGLQEDSEILALFRMLSINQNSQDAYNILIRNIHSRPCVIKKQTDKNPFHTPPKTNNKDDGIRIGIDENGQPYYLNVKNLVKHLLMAALTGFGKTNFFRNLMHAFNKQETKFIAIDFKRDTRALMKEIPMLILRFNERTTFKFNPLQPIPGVSRIEQFYLFIDVLAETTFLMDGSQSLLLDHLVQLDSEKSGKITIHDLYQSIQNAKFKTPRPLAWRDSCLRALKTMIMSFGNILDCIEGIPITALSEHNIVLELDEAGAFKSFWGTLIPAYYLKWKISNNIRGATAQLHAIFCDEGNLILRKAIQRNANMGIPTIITLIQTCREFGEAWLISTNEPLAMAETALVNTSTKIMARNGDWNNTMTMARTMTLTTPQAISTTKFGPGKCVITQEEQKHPYPIQLDYCQIPTHYITNEEVEKNNKPILSQYPIKERKDSSAKPEILKNTQCPQCDGQLAIKDGPYGKFIGCSQYPKCKYSTKLETAPKAPLRQEQQGLLWHIHQNPDQSKTQHYKALELSVGRADSMTKKMRHLIKEITIPTGQRGRQPIYLTLTSEGLESIGIKQKSTRGASTEHDFHVNRYLRQLQKAGIKAQASFTLKGKEADIGITLPSGKIIAVEISSTTTAEWELQQIIKNFEAGFDHNITVATNLAKAQKLTSEASQKLTQEQKDKTTITQIIHDIIIHIKKEAT